MSKVKCSYGVDLGTSFAKAAYIGLVNQITIIQSSEGENTIPAFVSYNSRSVDKMIGSAAKNLPFIPDLPVLYDAKKFIGKRFDRLEPKVIESYPFEILSRNGFACYRIMYNNRESFISPTEIDTEILKYIHNCYFRQITVLPLEIHVVIGVPALFSSKQREETIKAGINAGIGKITTIPEPSAAVLTYLDETRYEDDCKVLVFDFGAGKFECSVVEVKDKIISIIGVNGDDNLGGADVTKAMTKYITNKIKTDLGIDISRNFKTLKKVENECEAAKFLLSMCGVYPFYLTIGEKDYVETLTAEKLNEMCKDILDRAIYIINVTMKRCELTPNDIDYIIPAGGSSRLSFLREYLTETFKNIKVLTNINPDEVVVRGCALYSNYIANDDFEYKIIDYVPPEPLAIGVDLVSKISRVCFYDYAEDKYSVITFPSTVAFNKKTKEIKVGFDEKTIDNEKYSVVSDPIKYIGKKFSEIDKVDYEYENYTLIRAKGNKCFYKVVYNKKVHYYMPSQILSLILIFITKSLKHKELDGVISVPVNFTQNQREEVKKVAHESGMKVLQFIPQTICSLLYYLNKKEIIMPICNVLVCNFYSNDKVIPILTLNIKEKSKIGQELTNMVLENKANKFSGVANIDYIIVDGYSSQIPQIMKLVKKYFPSSHICRLHPEKAVSVGASIYSRLIIEKEENKLHISDYVTSKLG